MDAGVVIATYNWPAALELVLWGYAVQTQRPAEVIIADDGSGPETRATIERMRGATGLPLRHVWHEDRGFRKTEILNRAMLAAESDYLIFTDGDTIPRADLVATHCRLARRGWFLTGAHVDLPAAVSTRITVDDVRTGRATDLGWLRAQGFRPGRRALRFSRRPAWAALLDWVTPTPAKWRGNNSSGWRDDLFAVNGYDMAMGYGGEDAELGERLVNLGLRPRRIRFRALAVHLFHQRPWRDEAVIAQNRAHREWVRASGATRARLGIEELRAAGGG